MILKGSEEKGERGNRGKERMEIKRRQRNSQRIKKWGGEANISHIYKFRFFFQFIEILSDY